MHKLFETFVFFKSFTIETAERQAFVVFFVELNQLYMY